MFASSFDAPLYPPTIEFMQLAFILSNISAVNTNLLYDFWKTSISSTVFTLKIKFTLSIVNNVRFKSNLNNPIVPFSNVNGNVGDNRSFIAIVFKVKSFNPIPLI
jgi:hypothetical protein